MIGSYKEWAGPDHFGTVQYVVRVPPQSTRLHSYRIGCIPGRELKILDQLPFWGKILDIFEKFWNFPGKSMPFPESSGLYSLPTHRGHCLFPQVLQWS